MRIVGIVRIVVGQRDHRHDLAGLDVQHHGTRRDRLVFRHRLAEFVVDDVLYPQVDGELDRLQILGDRQA